MKTGDNRQSEVHDESFRDSIATINKEGERSWIFPTKPHGKFYNLRTYFTWFYLIIFFYVLPVLQNRNNGPNKSAWCNYLKLNMKKYISRMAWLLPYEVV